jgi:hypothetical protein
MSQNDTQRSVHAGPAATGGDRGLRPNAFSGDDYLTKPFDLEELVARVRAVLRRSADRDRAEAEFTGFRSWSGAPAPPGARADARNPWNPSSPDNRRGSW